MGINLKLLFSRLFSGAPIVVLCASIGGWAANFIPGISAKVLFSQCVIFSITYCLAVYCFGLNPEERKILNDFFKRRSLDTNQL